MEMEVEQTGSNYNLLSWASNKGIKINPKLDIFASIESTGRGVKALENIAKGEILVEIPQGAYIVPAIMYPDDKELPKIISVLRQKKLSGWMSMNRNFVIPIVKEFPDLWSESICTLNEFKYISNMITSRGFHTKEGHGPFMVPIADMFNHSSTKKSLTVTTEENNFRMTADKAIKKGEEIFNSYGELSNAQLLHTYGFVESENPFDNVLIPVELFLKHVANYVQDDSELKSSFEERKALLKSKHIIPDESFIISKEDMLPEEMLTALQVFSMDSEEYDEYKKDPVLLGSEYEADESTMLDSYQIIVEILSERLKMYPTSIKEDVSGLAKTSNPRIKACITIQISEKRLLLDLRAQLVEEIKQIEADMSEDEEEEKPTKKQKNSNSNKKK